MKQEASEAAPREDESHVECPACGRPMDGVKVKVAGKDGTGASLQDVEPAGCVSCVSALAEGWPGWTWQQCCKEHLGHEYRKVSSETFCSDEFAGYG